MAEQWEIDPIERPRVNPKALKALGYELQVIAEELSSGEHNLCVLALEPVAGLPKVKLAIRLLEDPDNGS